MPTKPRTAQYLVRETMQMLCERRSEIDQKMAALQEEQDRIFIKIIGTEKLRELAKVEIGKLPA